MFYTKKILAYLSCSCLTVAAFSQSTTFSLATDLGIQRSFKKEQQYWAVGQTVHFVFHAAPRDGVYAWMSYYSNGTFSNTLKAIAKSPLTNPQQIVYRNNAEMRIKHISLGWRRFLKGAPNSETWNIYSNAGFGLMLGRVVNTHEPGIDTTVYTIPVRSGKANFKRLTFDLGLGVEIHIGGDIYFYVEGRALVPASDYPSKHLFINDNAPFMATANGGVRILFD